MATKQGKELQAGDKVITLDGEILKITSLTNGMVRNARLAELSDGKWTHVYNHQEYEIAA